MLPCADSRGRFGDAWMSMTVSFVSEPKERRARSCLWLWVRVRVRPYAGASVLYGLTYKRIRGRAVAFLSRECAWCMAFTSFVIRDARGAACSMKLTPHPGGKQAEKERVSDLLLGVMPGRQNRVPSTRHTTILAWRAVPSPRFPGQAAAAEGDEPPAHRQLPPCSPPRWSHQLRRWA
eukprot:scaffold2921_cov124-Isochrysis_galbana.AAC.2